MHTFNFGHTRAALRIIPMPFNEPDGFLTDPQDTEIGKMLSGE
ncbi:hypothetical protein PNK_2447 [Candidatus Protochlamydia naegleriophila]|uniref:Uncharacterized protein n=1 Tax=Candidatus Protochlamydia naegleriophila TaxID=389348 RepID=A0A0U5JDJ2_9BACT|nr:hypothetical protein PNK_2447 [Candidatus Protochlamydia naegleriophila]